MSTARAILRVAIVDDEPLARVRMKRLLMEQADVEIIGEFGDGETAAQALPGLRCDAVFLDVHMPETDGFAMLDAMPAGRHPLVVFVTAHRQHALRAFDTWAVDYLLKPVGAERLAQSVARIRERTQQPGTTVATGGAGFAERIAVPDGNRLRIVRTEDIDVVLAQGNYVELRMASGNLLLRETLNHMEASLDPRRFLRIHRSRIVRVDLIQQIEPYAAGQYWLRLGNGMCVTSGRSYRDRLLRAYGLVA